MATGKMIVCDGGNGAGKSTLLTAIEQHLHDQGREVVMTREPGGTPIGEKVREILLSRDASEMSDVTELLLFAAARAQHVREKILPALAAGRVVVSDRFDSATFSFQHYARGLPLDLVTQVNTVATGGLKPDLTIVLDLDPAKGLERVGARGDALDRMELQDLEFLNRARAGYRAQAKADPTAFVVIDASQPLTAVIAFAIQEVERALKSDR
jgi:dTMP kinase